LSTFDHKVKPPMVLNGAVIRSHLLGAVLATTSYRVVFVQAPAGHGKTTLLQQFLTRVQALGVGTGWLTLDESDDDPTRFLEQFGGLIESAQASSANVAVGAAFAPKEGQSLGAVHEALHALSRDP
jgi:LuxR family transcriptional regulator, maltose regulon positive regulatory protein